MSFNNTIAGQSNRLLNFSGETEISFKFLQKKYSEDTANFYKYLKFSNKRFQAKHSRLNIKENHKHGFDKKILQVSIEEIKLLLENISTIQRFLSLLEGLNDEETVTILCLEQEYDVLKELFLDCLSNYDKFVDLRATEATVVDDTDAGTKKNKSLDYLKPNHTPDLYRQPDCENQDFVSCTDNKEQTDVDQLFTPVTSGYQTKYPNKVTSKSLSDNTTFYELDRSSLVQPHIEKIEDDLLVEVNKESVNLLSNNVYNSLSYLESIDRTGEKKVHTPVDIENLIFSNGLAGKLLDEFFTPGQEDTTGSNVEPQPETLDGSSFVEYLQENETNLHEYRAVVDKIKSNLIITNVNEKENTEELNSSVALASNITVDDYVNSSVCYSPELPIVQPTDTPPPSNVGSLL